MRTVEEIEVKEKPLYHVARLRRAQLYSDGDMKARIKDAADYLETIDAVIGGIPLSDLRSLCDAYRDNRAVVLPAGEINNQTTLWFVTKDGCVYKARAHELGNVIWYYKPKQFYLTREAAEAAKGEQQ